MIQVGWYRGLWAFAVLLTLVTGCQSKSTTGSGQTAEEKTDEANKIERPTTFPGKWALVVTQQVPDQSGKPAFRDMYVMLLEFKDGADGITGEVHATLQGGPKFELKGVKIDGDQCTLNLGVEQNNVEFQGTLKEGVVRGTMLVNGEGGVAPAMLLPTKETAYDPKSWDATPISPGTEYLVKAFGEKEQPKAVLQAGADLRGTPLSLEAYGSVFGRLAAFPQADEKSLKAIAFQFLDSASLWGPRMAEQVRASVILNTASSRRYPRVALEWLNDVEDPEKNKMSAEGMKIYGEAFKEARHQVTTDIALADLTVEDATVAKAGYETLVSKMESHRYNPEVLDALAVYANNHEMPDKAIEFWADVLAMPLLEGMWYRAQQGKPPGDRSPREQLMKLWEKKHGNTDGFDKFLEDTFNRRMGELAEEVRKAGPEKIASEENRTVLVELFTGATCPPCIAGDIALDLVTDDYPATKVIALRYHQHIPGPDPLANQDAEERFSYYEGASTPLMLIDGGTIPAPGIGGWMQHIGQSYAVLRGGVDARMKMASEVQIKATAALDNGEITVDASAVGWPEDKAKRLRLRMALVENAVDFQAPNGIRVHEHIVRAMIGGAKGTAVKSGQLAVNTKLSIADLKESLAEYLSQFEKNRSIQFPAKPLALESFSVVAWVQNDETREILQATIVPVTGSAVAAPAAGDAPASATAPENAKN